MNRTQLLIGVVVIITILLGIVGFRLLGKGNNTPGGEDTTPTPSPAYQEVDASVTASLVLSKNSKEVTMTISGLSGRYSAIEYEMNYQTDTGSQGTFSGATPISIESGADEFERQITLGSCSSGGRCTYDTGVRNFKLDAKLHTSDGSIHILRKIFESL